MGRYMGKKSSKKGHFLAIFGPFLVNFWPFLGRFLKSFSKSEFLILTVIYRFFVKIRARTIIFTNFGRVVSILEKLLNC